MKTWEDLNFIMSELLNSDVVLGPALTSVGIGGLDEQTHSVIVEAVEELIREQGIADRWTDATPSMSVSIELKRHALAEALSSTAAYLSHLRLGYLHMDDTMIRVAMRLLIQSMKNHGTLQVLRLIIMVNYFDNALAIRHYGSVHKSQFITGELHRPWIHYSLVDEVEAMIETEYVQQFEEDGHIKLQLTKLGIERFNMIHKFLKQTGFLSRRASLMRLSYFSHLHNYDEIVESMFPARAGRQEIIAELQKLPLTDGSRVLELGSGTGGLTIDAGLANLVGSLRGELIATEPSFGMLNRAKHKSEQRGSPNVRFMQMRAEELGFSDDTFDIITGAGYLQFTQVEQGIREAHRVLKPGGTFVTAYPINFPVAVPFFAEWFEPLLRMMQESSAQKDSFPEAHTVPHAMQGLFDDVEIRDVVYSIDYGNVENAVRFFIEIANVFESAMNQVPWRAKQDLIEQLIQRGHEIANKYSRENLRLHHPGQIVRARAVK